MTRLVVIDASQFDAIMKQLEDMGFEEDLTTAIVESFHNDTGLRTKMVRGRIPPEKVGHISHLHGVLAVHSPKDATTVS